MDEDRWRAKLAGFELPEPGPGQDSVGNDAWRRAQRLNLERQARERRN